MEAAMRLKLWLLPILVLGAMLSFLSAASADDGLGTLQAPTGTPPTGDVYNPTHWAVLIGDTITDTITGATDAVVGSGGCGVGVLVVIQSSDFGNTNLCGTLS